MSRFGTKLRREGFTLLEMIVVLGIFSLALSILAFTLISSRKLLVDTTGGAEASQKLRKVYLSLEEDLRSSSFATPAVANSVTTTGGGLAGDAFWCLSSEDPVTEQRARGSDGRALWQRNILYYPTVPSNHATLYGSVCSGGANAEGYDSVCPHKVLVRKVIDSGPATTPADPDSVETLLTVADITSYLSAPTGFQASLVGAGSQEARVLLPNLLTFRVQRAPEPTRWADELRFRIKITALDDLGKSVALGTADLDRAPQTEELEFSIFPENP